MLRRVILVALLCILPVVFAAVVVADETATPDAQETTKPAPVARTPYACVSSTMRLLQPHIVPMFVVRLKLTDEQKTEVTNLLTKAQKDTAAKVDTQRKTATDFALALAKADVTAAALESAVDKAMKAETELFRAKIKTLFVLKSKLTQEQNKELALLLKQYTNTWLPPEMRTGGPLGRLTTPTRGKPSPPEAPTEKN